MMPDDSTQMSEAQFQREQESERCLVADAANMTLSHLFRNHLLVLAAPFYYMSDHHDSIHVIEFEALYLLILSCY